MQGSRQGAHASSTLRHARASPPPPPHHHTHLLHFAVYQVASTQLDPHAVFAVMAQLLYRLLQDASDIWTKRRGRHTTASAGRHCRGAATAGPSWSADLAIAARQALQSGIFSPGIGARPPSVPPGRRAAKRAPPPLRRRRPFSSSAGSIGAPSVAVRVHGALAVHQRGVWQQAGEALACEGGPQRLQWLPPSRTFFFFRFFSLDITPFSRPASDPLSMLSPLSLSSSSSSLPTSSSSTSRDAAAAAVAASWCSTTTAAAIATTLLPVC